MTDEAGDRRPAPDHLIVGHISKPHGTRGELFVWPLTDRPDEVFREGRTLVLGAEDGSAGGDVGTCVIEGEPRPFKRGLLLKLVGRHERAAVEELAGRYLLVPTGELAPLDEDEVFYHELLGLRIETVEGATVGTVREVFETEPAHLLEVRGEGGKLHLIPFASRIVRKVDVAGGRIVIKPPPGLLEL